MNNKMNETNVTLSKQFQNLMGTLLKQRYKSRPLTYIYTHDRSLSWLGTDTSVNCSGV